MLLLVEKCWDSRTLLFFLLFLCLNSLACVYKFGDCVGVDHVMIYSERQMS